MLKRFKPKYRSLLGVDVSPIAVKILEISYSGKEPCIESYGYERLSPNSIETNTINEFNSLIFCIKKIVAEMNFSTKLAAIAVPDSMVISKTIQFVANLTSIELEELVYLEADKYRVYPTEELNIDFAILNSSEKSSGMLDVLLVASRAENVNRQLAIFSSTGLEVKIVDIESYAIARGIEHFLTANNSSAGPDKIIAVIELGYQFTHLCIIEQGKIIYTREEGFGTKQLYDALAGYYNLSVVDAIDLPLQSLTLVDYGQVFQPFIDSTVLQVKRSLQFFFSSCPFKAIDQIFLAGELVDLTPFAKKIEEETGFVTSVLNPLNHVRVSKKVNREQLRRLAPSFLIAFGLALRQINAN